MEWQDQGCLLSVRRHGESAAIIEVFTPDHGRHAGVVLGGASRKLRPILQPGAQLALSWRARLAEHIGTFRAEPILARAATIMNDRLALAGLNAICALLQFSLPERQPHPALYGSTLTLLDAVCSHDGWTPDYLNWELQLLRDVGFGLDLACCAVSGTSDDLAYVSPKSGAAVSRSAAGEWASKLLPYPVIERPVQGLVTTGYFLENWLAPSLGDRKIPAARARLINAIDKHLQGTQR